MDGETVSMAAAVIGVGSAVAGWVGVFIKIGRWQGGVDKMLEGHSKWMESQESRCKNQQDSCERRFDYIQNRINHADKVK